MDSLKRSESHLLVLESLATPISPLRIPSAWVRCSRPSPVEMYHAHERNVFETSLNVVGVAFYGGMWPRGQTWHSVYQILQASRLELLWNYLHLLGPASSGERRCDRARSGWNRVRNKQTLPSLKSFVIATARPICASIRVPRHRRKTFPQNLRSKVSGTAAGGSGCLQYFRNYLQHRSAQGFETKKDGSVAL